MWALAVILYEAITGRVPFGGPNYHALVFSIMTEAPTPTSEQAAGDAQLWSILEGGLAKRGVERPRMRGFGTDLAEWALAQGIESDIAGTSIGAHWMSTGTDRSPFSIAPAGMHADRMTSPDVVIPKAPLLPADVAVAVVAPRRRGRLGLALACLVGAAVLVAVWAARTSPTGAAGRPSGATADSRAHRSPRRRARRRSRRSPRRPRPSTRRRPAGRRRRRTPRRATDREAELEEAAEQLPPDREGAELSRSGWCRPATSEHDVWHRDRRATRTRRRDVLCRDGPDHSLTVAVL